jgi:hypothetical protein
MSLAIRIVDTGDTPVKPAKRKHTEPVILPATRHDYYAARQDQASGDIEHRSYLALLYDPAAIAAERIERENAEQ